MIRNPGIFDEEIKAYLVAHEDIFIQVIDKIYYSSDARFILPEDIEFYEERSGNEISSLIAIKSSQVYLDINENQLDSVAKLLNSYPRFFSMYGEKKIITKLTGKLRYKKRSQVDYYVMRIDLAENLPLRLTCEGFYCIPADINHFQLLKKLQHFYNLEEVYHGDIFYPYSLEMNAFKEKLRNRKNFAVFTDNPERKAVSKIYTNAESPDAYQIGGVYTLKKFRKKGLSFFCLTHLLGHAVEQKKRYVYLFVNKSNIPAINLYKKSGFTIVTETSIAYY